MCFWRGEKWGQLVQNGHDPNSLGPHFRHRYLPGATPSGISATSSNGPTTGSRGSAGVAGAGTQGRLYRLPWKRAAAPPWCLDVYDLAAQLEALADRLKMAVVSEVVSACAHRRPTRRPQFAALLQGRREHGAGWVDALASAAEPLTPRRA